jgi:hypothetical protein
MKTCWQCAEQIQDSAIRCRFCQVDQVGAGGAGKADASDGRRPVPPALFFGGLVGIFALLGSFVNEKDVAPAVPRPALQMATPAEVAQLAECGKAMDALVAMAVARRPSANRLDINEAEWFGLNADQKRQLMERLACSTYDRFPAELNGQDYVVIYGLNSGKRLAMMTSAGFSFD